MIEEATASKPFTNSKKYPEICKNRSSGSPGPNNTPYRPLHSTLAFRYSKNILLTAGCLLLSSGQPTANQFFCAFFSLQQHTSPVALPNPSPIVHSLRSGWHTWLSWRQHSSRTATLFAAACSRRGRSNRQAQTTRVAEQPPPSSKLAWHRHSRIPSSLAVVLVLPALASLSAGC